MTWQQVRIGARGSKLSLAQSGLVRAAIAANLARSGSEGNGSDGRAGGEAASLVVITTSGDRIQDRTLTEVGGKALFTKEIEEALLGGRIDCAVHSLKDMPAISPAGLVIAAIPRREDVRDAFVSDRFASLDALPRGARLGTASVRRAAQALHRRADLAIVPLRGNVDTRLAKLERGEADALILAAAGLVRLGLEGRIRCALDPAGAPPAPGQGALAVQTRAEDAGAPWLAGLNHPPTALAVAAERGALEALEGSCRTAVGAWARLEGDRLVLSVEALTPDGAVRYRREGSAKASAGETAARAMGLALGEAIRLEGGAALLAGG